MPTLSQRTHIHSRSSECWEPGKADPNLFPGMGALSAGGRFPNGCSSFSPIATQHLHFPHHSHQQTASGYFSCRGWGGSRAFTTLGEKLVSYLGQVGVHVSEGTGQQWAFPTSAALPERKAPSSWGHLQKCMFHFARKSGSKSIFSKPCWGTR